jgi:hypothetical protein
MVAVGRWLSASGISEIALLPGHHAGPGAQASSEIRRWWSKLPVYFTPIEDVRWQGHSLGEMLQSECGNSGELHELSGGAWRMWAYRSKTKWPAVCRNLERRKLLSIGKGGSVLWKFDGFNPSRGLMEARMEKNSNHLETRAVERFVPMPIKAAFGFVATTWIEGERMSKNEGRSQGVITHLGRYIRSTAMRALASGEGKKAVERLALMLRCNVGEAFGKNFDPHVDRLQRAAEQFGLQQSYGDGRLAPHEWVRTPSGKILKTDHDGHRYDHTVVGQQSFLWDIAGAIEEWDWEGPRLEWFLDSFAGTELQVDAGALQFYRCAYAAFRMGMFSLGIDQSIHDEEERERLIRAENRFKRKLEQLIKRP